MSVHKKFLFSKMDNILTDHIIPLVCTPFLYIIFIPLILPVFIVTKLVRLLINSILYYQYGGEIQVIAEGEDALYGHYKDGTTSTVLVSVTAQKGGFQAQDIITGLKNTINSQDSDGTYPYAKLKKILVKKYGYSCWKKDKNFAVDHHVRTIVGKNNNRSSDKEVKEWLSVLSENMDESKPQWEFVLFPHFVDSEGNSKSLAIFRFLHSYMDGLSFLMMAERHFSTGLSYYVHPLKFKIPPKVKFLFYLNFILKGPYAMIREMYLKFFKMHWQLPPDSVKSGKRNYSWVQKIQLDKVQSIRRKLGKQTSVTHVIISAATVALAKVLPENKRLPEIWIQEIMALLPYPDSKPQNRFTGFTYPVTMSAENPIQILKETSHNHTKGIMGALPLCYFYAMKYIGRLPSIFGKLLFHGTNHTICYSNVPLSREKVKCFGSELLEFYGHPPQRDENGLVLGSTTYSDGLFISANADETWMTELQLNKWLQQIPLVIDDMAK